MKLPDLADNDSLRYVLFAVIILTGFTFIVAFSTIYVQDAIVKEHTCGCFTPVPLMMLILSSLGVFVGSLSYYIIMSYYAKKRENKKNVDAEKTLKFLPPDERKIMELLIKEKNGLFQSEFEKIPGFYKVKVHRTLKSMKKKGIITKKKEGNSKRIFVSPELRELF